MVPGGGGSVSFKKDENLMELVPEVGLTLSFSNYADLFGEEASSWSYPLVVPSKPEKTVL